MPDSQPQNIVVESPGRTWFTLTGANAIGRLVVTSSTNYTFDTFPLPNANSEPYDLAFDGTYVWFTEQAGNRIGRLEIATGDIVEYVVPTANSQPTGIDIAPNGQIWFTERTGNKVVRFDPTNLTFHEYEYSVAGGLFGDIVVENNTTVAFSAPGLKLVIWFVESSDPDRRFFPKAVQRIPGGTSYTAANITLDEQNTAWIASPDGDGIAYYKFGTLALFRWSNLLTANSEPTGIVATGSDTEKRIWFTEMAAGRVALHVYNFDFHENVKYEMPLPTPNSGPTGIAVDADGHAWITERDGNNIAEWRPPYINLVSLPAIVR